ncbi:MAG: glycosyltransferase family 4 protein [Methanomassiliicoccus sp.]|nr:glycosyltransferase family 4 protein [Methanomassiliicoccus sp.]
MTAEKPSVCRVVYEFLPRTGGSVTHTVELAKKINAHCRNQFVIAPKMEGTEECDAALPFPVIRVKYPRFKLLGRLKRGRWFRWLPLQYLWVFSYGLCTVPEIIKLNREHGIDIIHVHGVYLGMSVAIASKLTGKPIVWMAHGAQDAYSEAEGRFETLATRLFSRVMPPDHLFVVEDGSPAPRKFTQVFPRRASVVYHSIDSERFFPMPRDEKLVQHLGLKDADFVVQSAHTLIPIKGVEHAITAFKEFLNINTRSSAVLVIAGGGNERASLERLVSDLGISNRVKFLGPISNSDMPRYYSICDVGLATSTYSNLNLSTQETMACGKPVIAFDSGQTSLLIQNMDTGILVRSGDTQELAKQLDHLYKNRTAAAAIGARAHDFIAKNRSWENRVATELKVYDELLSERGRG